MSVMPYGKLLEEVILWDRMSSCVVTNDMQLKAYFTVLTDQPFLQVSKAAVTCAC